MASMPYKQDLPPEGGYAPINYKRIPAKSVLNAPTIFGGLIGTMAYGYWSYKRGMRAFRKEEAGTRTRVSCFHGKRSTN